MFRLAAEPDASTITDCAENVLRTSSCHGRTSTIYGMTISLLSSLGRDGGPVHVLANLPTIELKERYHNR